MLFFAIPRLDKSIFSDENRKVSRWVLVNVDMLKSKAVQSRKQLALNVDMDANSFWISDEFMRPEDMDDAREKGYELPSGFRLLDVMYPDGERITSGAAQIRFYPQGHSDRAIIHMENDSDRRMSFFIEPFLSRVEIKESYAEY